MNKLKERLEIIIESAYQDMRGVKNGHSGYRLRHAELSNRILDVMIAEILKLGQTGNVVYTSNDVVRLLQAAKEED